MDCARGRFAEVKRLEAILYFVSLSSINFQEKGAPDDKEARKCALCSGKSGVELAALNHEPAHSKINISTEPYSLVLSHALSFTFTVQLYKSIRHGQDENKD
jgi:hypothetical protein